LFPVGNKQERPWKTWRNLIHMHFNIQNKVLPKLNRASLAEQDEPLNLASSFGLSLHVD
jgi:hypothetical protein